MNGSLSSAQLRELARQHEIAAMKLREAADALDAVGNLTAPQSGPVTFFGSGISFAGGPVAGCCSGVSLPIGQTTPIASGMVNPLEQAPPHPSDPIPSPMIDCFYTPHHGRSRLDELRYYLLVNGPSRRKTIIAASGLPVGTISTYLTKDFFAQDEDGRWMLRPEDISRIGGTQGQEGSEQG